MKIYLLGLPGSGKTTLGKELASALNLPFVDLDDEVERVEGMPIAEIFKKKKEDYFRTVEASELKRWSTSKNAFVMATGGGAPCFFDNMEIINRSGKSIFLDVPPSVIAQRIAKTRVQDRPLLAGGVEGLKDRIEFMRSNRILYYRQAQFIFSGNEIDAKEILKAIRR